MVGSGKPRLSGNGLVHLQGAEGMELVQFPYSSDQVGVHFIFIINYLNHKDNISPGTYPNIFLSASARAAGTGIQRRPFLLAWLGSKDQGTRVLEEGLAYRAAETKRIDINFSPAITCPTRACKSSRQNR